MNYSKAISIIRSARGLSKQDFSSACGVDKSLITRIESGERAPTQEVINEICRKLDIPEKLFELLAFSDDQSDGKALELGRMLLDVMNERGEVPRKKNQGIFTLKHLAFLLNEDVNELTHFANNITAEYTSFVSEKPGKKSRKLVSPSVRLKTLQKKIVSKILKNIPIHKSIYGGVSGRSIKDNAVLHIKQPEVVTLDLKKCFPNTSYKKIYQLFREVVPTSREVASVLTKLTTFRGELPQGAPSSSSLVNLILSPMYEEISLLLSSKGLRFSTWVDDITISGKNAHKHISVVVSIIQKYGYSISNSKVHIMGASLPQEVTGLIINSKLSVPRNKLLKYIAETENSSYPLLDKMTISGRIAFVNYINPKQKDRFVKKLKTKNLLSA